MTKESLKLLFSDSIAFDTAPITKEKSNYFNVIDTGKGNDLTQKLAILEFDPTLTAHLNLSHGQSFQILITHLGVEEFRAVLHYQLMQHQLLTMAIDHNQTLMDSSQKGLYELDFLSSKDELEFLLPNTTLNLSRVLAKNIEGYDLGSLNNEKVRFKNNFKNEVSKHIFSVCEIKNKLRSNVAKKFQIFMNKMATSEHKIEGKLRILRNYRIKLLHQYCREVLRDSYQETIKTQLLKVCDDLRLKSNLLPFKQKKDLLFYCGSGDFLENLSREIQRESILHNDTVYNIDQYQDGEFKTFFYIPHTIEICHLDNKTNSEMKQEIQYPYGTVDNINESDPEQLIRDYMVTKPTLIKKF